uniref:Ferredoxin-thioredoxin reductase, catalytic chain n=1 Tax=Sonderella linearis TaxID=110477 RepID=A0A1Z1MLK6_9FLOR|nr:ferredoxin thioreductase subunit b [Sonderella linearis]ARW66977.1 ferredoxin thioreductase subunit b [Sonderella linearis]
MNSSIYNDMPESFEAMCKFSEAYAKRTGTFFCTDISVTAVVIEGLSKHKDDYGAPLCPCRHYDNKVKEVANTYWNCPCVPMRERRECHCMLFLHKNNEFAGNSQIIDSSSLTDSIK